MELTLGSLEQAFLKYNMNSEMIATLGQLSVSAATTELTERGVVVSLWFFDSILELNSSFKRVEPAGIDKTGRFSIFAVTGGNKAGWAIVPRKNSLYVVQPGTE